LVLLLIGEFIIAQPENPFMELKKIVFVRISYHPYSRKINCLWGISLRRGIDQLAVAAVREITQTLPARLHISHALRSQWPARRAIIYWERDTGSRNTVIAQHPVIGFGKIENAFIVLSQIPVLAAARYSCRVWLIIWECQSYSVKTLAQDSSTNGSPVTTSHIGGLAFQAALQASEIL